MEAKKLAWMALTEKYNAVSETGARTEKQLHALYDNLKKKRHDKVGCIPDNIFFLFCKKKHLYKYRDNTKLYSCFPIQFHIATQ